MTKLISEIIRQNVSVVVDTEQAPVIVGIERAALKIAEMIEGNKLIETSNNTEPKY